MKYIVITFIILVGNLNTTFAAVLHDCGLVKIEEVITGPRHGAMMRVSNVNCKPPGSATNGWVCLDPNGEHMTLAESERLFAEITSLYLANRSIQLSIYDDIFVPGCGGNYPVLEDVRSR